MKCKICQDNGHGDRGILNFRIKTKDNKKYHTFKNSIVIGCGCYEPVHKFCIVKRILTEQSVVCSKCNNPYLVEFEQVDANICTKLNHYGHLGKLLLFILFCLICIGLIVVGAVYNFDPAYKYWRIVLIVVFSVFTLVFSYIVYRICSEANSELLTSKIKFISDGYSQVDQLKGAYKSSSFKVEKKDLAMFFQDVYKSVQKIDKKTKLVSYLSTLNTDLNINKDEAIEIKVESAISARISKKKDFSMLRNNNGISITNRGGFLPEAKTTMRILGSEKNITGDYFNKKELKKRETSKQILLAAVDDKHEEEEEIHLNNKTSKVDHNAYFNVVVDNKQKEKSDSNKNVAIKDSNSLKGKKDTKNNSNKDAIFIGNVDNKGFKENNSQTKLYNNNITNIYGVTQDNSHNNLVSTNSNHEIEGLTYLRDRAKDRDSAIGFNNLKLNTDEFFERLGSESEIIKVENGHLLHQHNRELVLNVSDSFDFINAKHGNTQGNESGFYLNSEEKFLPD